jgi:hypothetical protein
MTDEDVIAHILVKLPIDYPEVITSIQHKLDGPSADTLMLNQIHLCIQHFYFCITSNDADTSKGEGKNDDCADRIQGNVWKVRYHRHKTVSVGNDAVTTASLQGDIITQVGVNL